MNNEDIHPRTAELRAIMDTHNITAAQTGALVGRKAHTVRVWRLANGKRVIPEHTLAFLKSRLSRRRKAAQ